MEEFQEYIGQLTDEKRKIRENWLKLDQDLREDLANIYFSKDRLELTQIKDNLLKVIKSKKFAEFLKFFHATDEYPSIVNRLYLLEIDKIKVNHDWYEEVYHYFQEILVIIDEEIAILDYIITLKELNEEEKRLLDLMKGYGDKLNKIFRINIGSVVLLGYDDYSRIKLREIKTRLIQINRGRKVPAGRRILLNFLHWYNSRQISKSKKVFFGTSGSNYSSVGGKGKVVIGLNYKTKKTEVIKTIKHELMHSVLSCLNPVFEGIGHVGAKEIDDKYYLMSEGFAEWGAMHLLYEGTFNEFVRNKQDSFVQKTERMRGKLFRIKLDLLLQSYILASKFFKVIYDNFGLNAVIFVVKNPDIVMREDILNPNQFLYKMRTGQLTF